MRKPLEKSLLAALALLTAGLLWVGLGLRVELFDTYEIFLNAKAIAHLPGGWYTPRRPFALPLLFAPVVRLTHAFTSDEATASLVLCHAVSIVLFALLGWCVFRLFRRHLSRLQALGGAGLLLVNPLIIHAAPFSKEDIPGALCMTAACLFYLEARDVLAGICFLLVAGTRYNLIPLFPALLVAHQLLTRRKLEWRRGGWLIAAPLAAWVVVSSAIYWWIGRAPFLEAPVLLVRELARLTGVVVGSVMPYREYPWENGVFLFKSLTPPLFLAALWGLWSAWRKRQPGSLFHALWLGLLLAFQSFVIEHKEARYLFPLFAPLYFFVVVGLADLARRFERRVGRCWLPAAAGLLLALPAFAAVREYARFFDPFYSRPFAAEVSRDADTLAGPHRVLWMGPFYAIHPRDYVFDVEDEVTYLYHLYAHTVLYYTGRPKLDYGGAIRAYRSSSPIAGFFVQPELAVNLQEGDVLILNRESASYVTKDVPATLAPLVVERARVLAFNRVSASGATRARYEAVGLKGAGIDAAIEKNGTFTARASGLVPRPYELLLELGQGHGRAGVDVFEAPRGTFRFETRSLEGGLPEKFLLLHFDSVKLYSTSW